MLQGSSFEAVVMPSTIPVTTNGDHYNFIPDKVVYIRNQFQQQNLAFWVLGSPLFVLSTCTWLRLSKWSPTLTSGNLT